MFKLCFYVPGDHLETVKTAVFAAGAGQQGDYDCCCFQVKGLGQFRPLAGSDPFIGEKDKLETVEEWRVEMLCAEEVLEAAIAALRLSHPYEEPAIDVWRLENLP